MAELHIYTLAMLISEGLFIGLVLLTLFHFREKLGHNAIYLTLGVFQYLQAALASSVYIEIFPNILVSPGSSVLFTASVFMILLVYIRDDATEARKLIYSVVLANIILSAFMLILGEQLDWLHEQNTNKSFDDFITPPRILLAGTATLLIDLLLIIIIFEAISKLTKNIFIRIFCAMTFVLTVDTIIFSTASFYGQANLGEIIKSGIVGKMIMAFVFSSIMIAYFYFSQKKEHLSSIKGASTRDVFTFLTYRQKYEILKKIVSKDALTGLYNRGHLNETLPKEIELSLQANRLMALVMLDIDYFKRVNDKYGHVVGDKVIQLVAKVIKRNTRQIDTACRYGGEEFAIILPNTNQEQAVLFAERLQNSLALAFEKEEKDLPCPVTTTIGIAFASTSLNDKTDSAEALLDQADNRLYSGKHSGRNCIVWRDC